MKQSFDIEDKSDIVADLLHRFAREGIVKQSRQGWNILCPFHDETKPSCLVFPTGVFHCLGGCGSKSPREGFKKIGVPQELVDRHWGRNAQPDVGKMRPLPTLKEMFSDEEDALTPVEDSSSVYLREPWPTDWSFRDIEPSFLSDRSSPLVELFQPSLVRIWTKQGTARVAERFPRLSLRLAKSEHEVYLRLSTQQEKRVYNSCGLDQKNPDLLPFGLDDWTLRPGIKGLLVVEGPYDLLRCSQNLLKMGRVWYDILPVVALLGIGQWPTFRKKFELRLLPQLLKNDLRLVTAFDNDKAGDALTSQSLREIVEDNFWLPPRLVSVLNYSAKDPGDLGFEGFKGAVTKIFH